MIVWIVEWSIIYRLIDVWDGVEQSVINLTIPSHEQWRKRIHACIWARRDFGYSYLDLDLVPPVPDGTLGDEISPSVSTVGSSLCSVPS